MSDIYGKYEAALVPIGEQVLQAIEARARQQGGHPLIEHSCMRVKAEASMREKCVAQGHVPGPQAALRAIHDAIGVRVVTRFVDQIEPLCAIVRSLPGVRVVQEKDYIRTAKANGYRSYHLILEVRAPYEDVDGHNPGSWLVEVQLRTIAMDTWASLEHEMRYKKNVANERLIAAELKRIADELASCDLSMQTIRRMILGGEDEA